VNAIATAIAPTLGLPGILAGTEGVDDALFSFYAANLRASFFSGFLTLGGFLVAVNTFIIVQLKKELYDHDAYRDRVVARQALRKANEGADGRRLGFYGPLRRLSRCILTAIVLAVVTAVSQLTIGLYPSHFCTIICIALAGVTVISLGVVLVMIACNLRDWFEFMEHAAEQKTKARDPQDGELGSPK